MKNIGFTGRVGGDELSKTTENEWLERKKQISK